MTNMLLWADRKEADDSWLSAHMQISIMDVELMSRIELFGVYTVLMTFDYEAIKRSMFSLETLTRLATSGRN